MEAKYTFTAYFVDGPLDGQKFTIEAFSTNYYYPVGAIHSVALKEPKNYAHKYSKCAVKDMMKYQGVVILL